MGCRALCLMLGALLLAACDTVPATPTVLPTASPTWAPPTAEAPTPIPLDSGWQAARPGLEWRELNIVDDEGGWRERITVVRLDPDYYQFEVAYRPGEPQSLAAWQAETAADLVVNAGYFTDSYQATGLVITEGVASGQSYGPFAGMFAVTALGPELRWLQERPYDPNEPLWAAVQSFPVLVKPGGRLGYVEQDDRSARRTVVAQDAQGHILFLIASRGYFTLDRLSQYLVESDLALDVALNLDGGTSTGLFVREPLIEIGAFVPLPTVIVAYAR